jgi:WD40 repeat protein
VTGGFATGTRRVVLEAYQRALRRETHVVTARPYLLWQQLYNRLQWEDECVEKRIASQRERRRRSGEPAWFRTRKPAPESGSLVRTLVGHSGYVRCCAFSADGRRLVSGGQDGTVRVWDTVAGVQTAILYGHEGMVTDCDMVRESEHVVTTGQDGTLRAWAIDTGTALGALLEVDGPLLSCAVSPRGERVFAAGVDGALHVVPLLAALGMGDAETHRPAGGDGPAISAVVVSPDGAAVVCGHADGSVTIWDPGSSPPRLVARLGTHADVVFAACFSPDGATLLTGDGLGVLRLWDWRARSLITQIQAHAGAINDCVVLAGGSRLITVGDDARVRIGPLRSEHPTTTPLSVVVGCCSVSEPEGYLATGSDDGTIRIWELEPDYAEASVTAAGHERWAVASTFSADGSRLVTGGRDGDIIVWSSETGETIASFGPQPGLEWCALSPDGARVISCGDEAMLWDVASGSREAVLNWTPPVVWCGFSPDGELVAGFNPQGIQVWDLTETDPPFVTRLTGKRLAGDKTQRVLSPDFDFKAFRCAFSPQGSRLAIPCPDGTVLVQEVDDERPQVLGQHTGVVSACAWDLDGRVLASAGEDQVIRLWNVRDRAPLGTLEGHEAWVNHLGFLDRGLLVSVSSDGTVRLWDTQVGEALCCYPAVGNVFLSCATHPDHRWLCVTDIAGDVHWLVLEMGSGRMSL